MALESAYYTWLLESLPGGDYNRTKVREIVNDAQNEILGARDGRLMQVKPDPFLVVTDSSVKLYVANDSIFSARDGVTQFDIRRVRRVYSFTDRNNPIASYGGFGSGTQPFPPYQKNPAAVPEIEFPIQVTDSNGPLLDDCKVEFHADFSPAESDDLYRCEAWEWPTQLTAENIQIKIPIQFRKSLLYYAVLSKIETRDFGRDDTIMPKLENAKAEWYRYDELSNADYRPQRTPPRWC